MATISRPTITNASRLEEIELPEQISIGLTEIVTNAREGLLAFSVGVGLSVLHELMQAEVTSIVGPKGKHNPERKAVRHGHEDGEVTLGGRRAKVSRPRARTLSDEEVELKTYRTFSDRDQLTEAAMVRMLAGLSTRRYGAGLEPAGAENLATSKSAVSRRFVEGTQRKLAEVMGRDLSELDLVALFIDGKILGEHCVVVSLGVDSEGRKHPLGLWEGSTENKAVCNSLLGNLIERGLETERPMLFVIDGGKAIRGAIRDHFGANAPVQRCREHKRRNVLDHLPEQDRSWVGRRMRRAWAHANPEGAKRQLLDLAKQLENEHPGAAASLREGLDETLTITRLGLSPTLQRTLKTTNPIESMISVGARTANNVTRWRNGQMALRWAAAGMLEAEKQFRRINGHAEIPKLRAALAATRPAGTGEEAA